MLTDATSVVVPTRSVLRIGDAAFTKEVIAAAHAKTNNEQRVTRCGCFKGIINMHREEKSLSLLRKNGLGTVQITIYMC